MKILHTSDWHLGQEFYSYDRTEEHTSFLNQLKQIVADEHPDVLVVCGDIYHNASPSNATMKLFTDHLIQIQEKCPSMKIIVTAGNHDSSARLETARNLWKKFNIEMIGHIEKADNEINFDQHIIRVNNSDGNPIGFVVAMPHVFPQSFPLVSEDTPREQRQYAFWQELNNRLNQANPDKLPVVMMAHMAITGCNITGHDESRGGMDYTPIDSITVDYDYMALGHIHCPQNIKSENKYARYCGTPIPVSFDEDYEHSVSIVEIASGAEPKIKTIKIDNPIPLVTIPKNAASFKDVLEELVAISNDKQMYVRLNIKFDQDVPRLIREQAIEALKDKQARFCTIKWERPEAATSSSQQAHIATEEMLTKSPLDIAKLHYERINGSEMGQEMIDKLNEVINCINNLES